MTAHIDVQALTPEAALGLLSGDERAEVLDHLESCEHCRELMHELSVVADELVLLAPTADPSAGFEQRVLRSIGAARARRRWPVVVASMAAALLAVVGFAVGRFGAGSAAPSVHEVAMRTPAGTVVGDAYLHGHDPTWVFVAVPGWTDGTNDYRLRVTLADGTTMDVPGAGSWGTVLSVDSASVREISLVGSDGKVWCSATV
jgi:hypothetical protein